MATTYGLQTLTFGTPTKSGYVVQSSSTSATNGVVAEVLDNSGVRRAVRYDDETIELSLEAVLHASTTLPSPGGSFAYDGETYEVLSVEKKSANNDFVKVAIKGKKSQGVTVS